MELQEKLAELAIQFGVPGAVAGVITDGGSMTATFGVTNLDHPLAVEEDTLFQFGSTGKTLTATALMVLAERGTIDLDAPVRTYLPGLRLKDETVAAQVTVLQLLNHTAGWAGDVITDTGDGDDCRAAYVDTMAEFDQVSPLGATVSYNNASLILAGRVLEVVTGTTYEQAVRDLVLTPLGLERTFGSGKEIMTMGYASGHTRAEDGTVTVSTPWALPRSGAPAGGWTATIGDQLAWARFHLGQEPSAMLSEESRRRMQQPTITTPGSALGDAVGVSWLLETIGGALVVHHGGATIGQLSSFDMVPERGFAVVCMTNCSPTGAKLCGELKTWAFEHYLGIVAAEPELANVSDHDLAGYAGSYHMGTVARADITVAAGRLLAVLTILDEKLRAAGDPASQPPIALAMLASGADTYVVAEGDSKGTRGYFTKDAAGAVTGMNLGGRDLTRG